MKVAEQEENKKRKSSGAGSGCGMARVAGMVVGVAVWVQMA
jgi:hypothetical protein